MRDQEEYNPLNYFSSFNNSISRLFNPKIEVIHPKVVENYLIGDVLTEMIRKDAK